jgi:hypothetical protein
VRARDVVLDREVVELLADEPELLAIADAITTTQPRPRRRGSRIGALAAAVIAVGTVLVVLPDRGGDSSLLADALAAVGRGPVVHARIETVLPATNVIVLATGRARPQTIAIEYWFDEPRGRLRTVVRRGGVAVDEFLQTQAGAMSNRGLVRLAPGAQPALDPALAGFVTRYRDALASGEARVEEEGELEGRRVVWLLLSASGVRERVAVDAETYVPLQITPLDPSGGVSPFSWRVRVIETVARVEADFAAPKARPVAPFRGDVRESRPISSGQAAGAVAWPVLWLGQSWRGLRLVSLEQETLTRGYPPESRVRADRGEGLRLRYAVDGADTYVELSQAPFPEPAYAFAGGELTFNGNPIPLEGSIELVELGARPGRAIGQLRRDGVYVTIWASSRELALEAARGLRRMVR